MSRIKLYLRNETDNERSRYVCFCFRFYFTLNFGDYIGLQDLLLSLIQSNKKYTTFNESLDDCSLTFASYSSQVKLICQAIFRNRVLRSLVDIGRYASLNNFPLLAGCRMHALRYILKIPNFSNFSKIQVIQRSITKV